MKKIWAFALALLMSVSMASCGSSTADTSSDVDVTVEETQAVSTETYTVEYGDFDGQQALSKKIQNGEVLGATVEIEGTVKKVGSSNSIGQAKDGEFTGTTYTFDGEYPAENSHVKLVGTVVGEGLVFSIEATSVEVVE